jgi:hypothetical protein
MINLWEGVGTHAEASAFCDLWGIDGTVMVDEAGDYARLLGIRGVPTNVFVDATGVVTAVGAVAPRELETEIRRLLGPDAPIDPA